MDIGGDRIRSAEERRQEPLGRVLVRIDRLICGIVVNGRKWYDAFDVCHVSREHRWEQGTGAGKPRLCLIAQKDLIESSS